MVDSMHGSMFGEALGSVIGHRLGAPAPLMEPALSLLPRSRFWRAIVAVCLSLWFAVAFSGFGLMAGLILGKIAEVWGL